VVPLINSEQELIISMDGEPGVKYTLSFAHKFQMLHLGSQSIIVQQIFCSNGMSHSITVYQYLDIILQCRKKALILQKPLIT